MSKETDKILTKLSDEGFINASQDTLNGVAKGAGHYMRAKTLPKYFHLRNKWSRGSIIPKPGKSFGLVPRSKKNINTMFSKAGSNNQNLADQNEGFKKKNPSIPISGHSRRGGTFPGKVSAASRLKKLKNNVRTIRDVRSKARTKRGRTFAMLSIMQRRGYRGSFFLDVNGAFVRGHYKFKSNRISKNKSGFNRLKFIRQQTKRTITYKKRPWFDDMNRKFQTKRTMLFYWNKSVKRNIDPLFRR
jgi:hypothetical protein